MGRRISPAWWPVLALASPVLAPALWARGRVFCRDAEEAAADNAARIAATRPLDLPEVDWLELRVLADWRAKEGYRGEAGVSCLFRTPLGSLLFDVAFGDETGVVAHNAARLGIKPSDIDAVALSHLHNDHMGGTEAFRAKAVRFPASLQPAKPVPCFLPAAASADGFEARVVEAPRLLTAGIASTGPLARRLFSQSWRWATAAALAFRSPMASMEK